MLAYYYVKNMYKNINNERMFSLYNQRESVMLPESKIIDLVRSNSIVLANYHINPNSNKLTKLHTNTVILEEKGFQYFIMTNINYNGYTGKYIVIEHINRLNKLLEKPYTAEDSKFETRLLDAIDLYISYMHDTEIKIVNVTERKAARIKVNLDNSEIINIQQESLNRASEFDKFKINVYDIQEYYFLTDLIKCSLKTNRAACKKLLGILYKVIQSIEYTFLGEQMDKYFCNDLLTKYNESVFKNLNITINRLSNYDRKNKANDCVKFFINGYNKFSDKLQQNRSSIISAINNSTEAMQLQNELDRLNNYTINEIKLTGLNQYDDKYKAFITDNFIKTDKILSIMRKYVLDKKRGKLINCLSAVLGTGSETFLSLAEVSEPNTAMQLATGGVVLNTLKVGLDIYNTNTETSKLASTLADEALNTKLPNKTVEKIKELRKFNLFYFHCFMYTYGIVFFEYELYKITKHKRSYWQKDFKEDTVKIKAKKDKLFSKLFNYNDILSYNKSYMALMENIIVIDTHGIHYRVYDAKLPELGNEYTLYGFASRWISACRIAYYKLDYNKIYNADIADNIFWKLVDDTATITGLHWHPEKTDEIIQKYTDALNESLHIKLMRSKDSNMNIYNFIKA